jgi:hypothetical protein
MLVASLAGIVLMNGQTLTLSGSEGPGKGKHIVLLAGDEEYRSEEMLPQLARILSERHGFKCTVVFSLNEQGEIDPNARTRQPGLEALKSADICVMMLRFRHWDDSQMKLFVDYYLSGKPIVALRTSTHSFNYPPDSTSSYRKYSWRSTEWHGGFGKQVLGETWVSHWGNHGSQATRGIAVKSHPILSGVIDVFGTTDVYEAAPPADADILMRGEVVAGMNSSDPPAKGRKKTAAGVEQDLNDPMMPILWTREPINEAGKRNRIVTCTMGAATDFLNEGFRRVVVNSVFWSAKMSVPRRANVDIVGEYVPTNFGFEGFKKGVRP